jgi:SAM-dependent methyltransferase
MDITRFSLLAEMRRYINEIRPLPALASLKEDVQGLMGLMPEYNAMLKQQVDIVDRASTDFVGIQSCIATMKQEIDTKYYEILAHLSTHDYFAKNLAISKSVRENWVMYSSVLDHILVEASMIKDQWKYPAVCVNAQHIDLVNTLLTFDLLYMVDPDRTMLDQQYDVVEDGVKNRLKKHPVFNFEDLDFANQTLPMPNGLKFGVPLGQMAMVAVPNVFERFPADTTKRVLEQIKPLLRPGGKIVFNVFDAESPSVAQMMADSICAGITQNQLNNIANELGLVVRSWQRVLANDFVVVVLAMPGELHSSKVKSSSAFRRKS